MRGLRTDRHAAAGVGGEHGRTVLGREREDTDVVLDRALVGGGGEPAAHRVHRTLAGQERLLGRRVVAGEAGLVDVLLVDQTDELPSGVLEQRIGELDLARPALGQPVRSLPVHVGADERGPQVRGREGVLAAPAHDERIDARLLQRGGVLQQLPVRLRRRIDTGCAEYGLAVVDERRRLGVVRELVDLAADGVGAREGERLQLRVGERRELPRLGEPRRRHRDHHVRELTRAKQLLGVPGAVGAGRDELLDPHPRHLLLRAGDGRVPVLRVQVRRLEGQKGQGGLAVPVVGGRRAGRAARTGDKAKKQQGHGGSGDTVHGSRSFQAEVDGRGGRERAAARAVLFLLPSEIKRLDSPPGPPPRQGGRFTSLPHRGPIPHCCAGSTRPQCCVPCTPPRTPG